jgi:hypothetical protein
MFTEEMQEADAKTVAAAREQAESNKEADYWREIVRRARELNKRAEQAGVPSSLVAALVLANAIEGFGYEIKRAAKSSNGDAPARVADVLTKQRH